MLQEVDVGKRSIDAYRGLVSDDLLDRLRERADDLRGLRVLQVNATPYGGGVSELLRSMVPLLEDLGIEASWQVIHGDGDFFETTKALHNALQGAEIELDDDKIETYQRTTEMNGAAIEPAGWDCVIVHDPQPAGLPSAAGRNGCNWVWRCHVDTSEPNRQAWDFLRGYLDEYDAAVYTMPQFLPPDLPVSDVELIPPAIDPLSPKNLDLPAGLGRELLSWLGLELDRPTIAQISRFDTWKDPLGVIAAHRLTREEHPRLQLVLAGSMALDDPEGFDIYHELVDEARSDDSIHVMTNLTGVGNIEVNALQRLCDVVVQKSIREGFGLVVSEALWKATPVVAGDTGGIPLQMADGVGGKLINSVEECAEAITGLLDDPQHASELGRRGRERVRERFCMPRLLLNELDLLARVQGVEAERPAALEHDPVCGMAIDHGAPQITLEHRGRRYRFCSEYCRGKFGKHPELWPSED